METQANGSAPAQTQQPVHPIHEEQALLNRLTDYVANSEDNDPHAGTSMEEPKKEPPQEKAAQEEKEEPQKEEQQAAPDTESVEIPEEDPLFEIEYKSDTGKEKKKLSLKELREGYLAKQDYHRNIQKVKAQEAELAEKVRQAETVAAQQVAQQLETYKQFLVQAVAPELQGVDLNKLAMEDPAEAQRMFFKQLQFNQKLQQLDQAQKQAQAKVEGERRKQLTEAVSKARETLERDIEGWSDERYQTLMKTAVEDYGFNQQSVANAIDPSFFKVLNDAYAYRQLQKAKPEVSKRVVTVPKVLKPGSVETKNTGSDKEAELAKVLKKSGRPEDAAALYLARQKRR